MDTLVSFSEAIDSAKETGEPLSILLGNGFSIAYDADSFSYKKLLEKAEFDGAKKDELFEALGTEDFERAIDSLRRAASLADMYGSSHADLARRMRQDADAVKNGLSSVLAQIHPNSSSAISDDEVRCAGRFLANFDNIFTLNYDLLLYWVLLKNRDFGILLAAGYDGFGKPTSGVDTLVWKGERQYLHYLHGALHLFLEEGPDQLTGLEKLTRKYGRLMDQIQNKIAADRYPHVVTEGSMREKMDKISQSPYLKFCMEALLKVRGSLFMYGVGLNENDTHIRAAIALSRVSRLFVSIRSDSSSAALKARVGDIVDRRSGKGGEAIEVVYYDAATADAWRVPT